MDTKADMFHLNPKGHDDFWSGLNITSKNIKTNTGLQVRERKRLLIFHGVILKSIGAVSQQKQVSYAVAVGAYCITSLSNSFSCRKTKSRGNSLTPGKNI